MIEITKRKGYTEGMWGVKTMVENNKRRHRACFTGHRPHKLHQPESVVIAALEAKIREAIDDGFVTFISGMAWGVDIWAAEIVLRLKAEGHPIHLIAAVPYEGFEKSWDDDWKQRYHEALAAADLVKYVCEHYHRGCYQIRNEWMVDRSARLIAAYTGEKGGTKNTVDYAARKGVQTVFVL